MIRLFYNDTFKNYFLLMVSLFINEVLFRLFVGITLFDISMLRIFVGVNLISLILVALYSFCGRIVSNILTFLTALLWTLFALMQIGFYNMFGTFISVTMFSQFNVVKDYIMQYFSNFSLQYLTMFIPIIIMGLFYVTCDHRIQVLQRNDEIDFADKFDSLERKQLNEKNFAKKRKKRWINSKINAMVISAFFAGIYYFTLITPLMQSGMPLISSMELFLNPDVTKLAVKEFGYTGYGIIDLRDMLAPIINVKGNEYVDTFNKKEQVESDFIRRIDDSLWIKINEGEKVKEYKTLNNYYLSQEITDRNDLTGFFRNKNLIMISMASINEMAINEKYFPNIYKLYKEGWSWENSYTNLTPCSGIDSEISSLSSVYTVGNACTGVKYQGRTYPNSLFHLFSDTEYSTSSYHNYSEQFYNRAQVHNNLGSKNYYGVQKLGIPYSNVYNEWANDTTLMEKVLKNIKSEDKFMTVISTSSTNFPYDVSSEIGDRYLEEFNTGNIEMSIKRYYSKIKELDEAIGILIDGLSEQGKLDNTVIILYSSGYPYGLSKDTVNKYLEYDVNIENNIAKTPFIIYNTEMQGQVYKEYTSTINIVPTVANLFGLSYDPRLYAGKDILDSSYENRVVFSDGSWKDSKGYYDAITGKMNYLDLNNAYSQEELKEINKNIKYRITMSSLAIRTDYFGHLAKQINDTRIQEIENLAKRKEQEALAKELEVQEESDTTEEE